MSAAVRTIRYADPAEPQQTLEVRHVHTWKREDLPAPIMSSSSGPKDYLKNQAYEIFQSNPDLIEIVIVRGNGWFLSLLHSKDGYWFDCTGKQVVNGNVFTQ